MTTGDRWRAAVLDQFEYTEAERRLSGSPGNTVAEAHLRVIAQLEDRLPEAAAQLADAEAAAQLADAEAAAQLADAEPELLAFSHFPKEHWRQLWSTNSLERLNKEIRRPPMSSASSPTAPRSSDWSAPSSPNSKTSGP